MAKVTVNLSLAKKQIAQFKKRGAVALIDTIQEEIKKEISGGRSPVKGNGRFPRYSKSYRDQISEGIYNRYGKARSPVNLKLTGELMSSLFAKIRKGALFVGFDNKLADIHNKQGAGKSKTVRRMLPTEKGEQFNRSITTRLGEILNRVAKNIFR